jgi:hypothetical protein
MLDTIKLFTKDFDIAKANNFQQSVTTAFATGEVKSEKLFCNTEAGHFDIRQHGADRCLFFTASVPKLLYGTSLYEAQEQDFERTLQEMTVQFRKAGVVVDKEAYSSMAVSRIDYCRNIPVQHSIVDYLALLRNCTFGMRNRTSWKTETVLFFNGSQEFTAYNKLLEVKNSPVQSAAAGITAETPENILRFESRLKAAEVVKRVLHCRSFSECWNFKLAKEKLLQDFDTIIQNVGQQLELNFMEDSEKLLLLRDKVKRNSFFLFISEKGIPLFLAQYNNDFELIKKLLYTAYQKRQALYYLKQLKQFYAEHRTPQDRHLLQELREKLAA